MSFLRKLRKALQSLPDPLFRRALRHGVAPSHEHRDILQNLGVLNTVVDVGANVGQFALLTLRVQPKAVIHSFEPLAAAADTFRKVIGQNARVTLHRCALGAEEAIMPIHVTSRADSSSLLVPTLQPKIFRGTHTVRREEVSVMPLHLAMPADRITAPALLKIDVQGFEAQVLEGCSAVLDRFEWIFVELSFVELYASQKLAPEIIDWLHARGFRLCSVYTDAHSYLDGKMIQGDFLFRALRQPTDAAGHDA